MTSRTAAGIYIQTATRRYSNRVDIGLNPPSNQPTRALHWNIQDCSAARYLPSFPVDITAFLSDAMEREYLSSWELFTTNGAMKHTRCPGFRSLTKMNLPEESTNYV